MISNDDLEVELRFGGRLERDGSGRRCNSPCQKIVCSEKEYVVQLPLVLRDYTKFVDDDLCVGSCSLKQALEFSNYFFW
jgi:hypothetical protein